MACLPAGPEVMTLVLACWEAGLHLRVAAPQRDETAHASDGFVPKLVVAEDATMPNSSAPQVTPDDLEADGREQDVPPRDMEASAGGEPVDAPEQAVLSGTAEGGIEAMGAAVLLRSVENLRAVQPVIAGEMLASGSPPQTLEGVFISVVVPLVLGLHVAVADGAAGPVAFGGALEGAALCELAAVDWLRPEWAGPTGVLGSPRALLCGSGRLSAAEAARIESHMGRPIRRGFGTAQAGLWAVTLGDAGEAGAERDGAQYAVAVRPLRSPLRLHKGMHGANSLAAPGQTGEIVLRPATGEGVEQRTGAVGWIEARGGVEVAGRLSDVVVRGGQTVLLTEVDRCLQDNPLVRESRTFRETGVLPTEKSICVCVTEADEASVRAWLHAQGVPVPDRLLVVEPAACPALPEVAALRAVASGQAGQAMVKSLTARRFRRNPAYNEAGLAAATERAVLADEPLRFLMFWGCGPRRHAAGPDRAALEALGDLLATAAQAAPVRAEAHVVFTDLHATNNGHSEAHYSTYFGEVTALARGLPVGFEMESAVWQRGGLSRAQVVALEGEPGFEEKWERFPLRTRFIQQAGRHSRMIDKVAAARHYYATCLLERVVLRSLFARSVFLTYNGPEFNECFPDLPTLYVYPGPRGRNDKPWFIDELGQAEGGGALQVEAA